MPAIPQTPLLLPSPRRIDLRPGRVQCAAGDRLQTSIDPASLAPQGYVLSISSTTIKIIGHDAAGVFYGRQTLAQLVRRFGPSLPCMEIKDWPDFPARGVMLDVSRDKVPTLQTLFGLVDMLAEWKINQLQLYIEHTFAYQQHRDVWKDASPFTADEIRQLDAYCGERFIELVPNQNSFGHMERWLKHPRYLPLAESAEGANTPWGTYWKGPFSLCATDPRSIELLRGLYDELLPNFSSRLFNVGCDETFDIDQGRSAKAAALRGTTRVYVDFLKQVHELVRERGHTMMFWGDIIRKQPELLGEVRGAIGLVWEYEAGPKFDEDGALFARAGVPFYVCPGTSSWCSIAGRTENMLANAKSAAEDGRKHGAIGYLMTDWGDYGHLQYLPISFAGFAAGAAYSWCLAANHDLPLASALDLHAFQDEAGVMGQIACDLGNVYKATGILIGNASALFHILVPSLSRGKQAGGLTLDGLTAATAAIDAAIEPLDRAKMHRADANLISAEYRNAAAMLRYACHRGSFELDPSQSSAAAMDEELTPIIAEHRRLWLARNRSGGLKDSARRLEKHLSEWSHS